MALIDVVIPVYNRAHCIASLIPELEKQTMKQFRAIFVDDGSTDGTYEVLEKCLENVSFSYEILRKENGGAASARNAGIRAATAPWIGFVDSDDALLPEYLEYMYRAATEADAPLSVCKFEITMQNADAGIPSAEPFAYHVITGEDCMRRYYTNWFGVYNLLLSRELQQKHTLFFDEECYYHEDIPFITNVIAVAERVSVVEQALYVYYAYEGSLSHSPRLDKFYSGIDAFERMKQRVETLDTAAAAAFQKMGSARYYIATMRKAAVQVDYKTFLTLGERVAFQRFSHQLEQLSGAQKLAGRLFLLSKPLFYFLVRRVFKD